MDNPTNSPKGKSTGRFYARPRRFFDVLQRDGTRVPISGWEIEDTRDGKKVSGIVLLEDPTEEQFLEAFEEQIGDPQTFIKAAELLHEAIRSLARKPDSTRPELSLQSVIIPEHPVAEGMLIASTNDLWLTIVDELKADWSRASSIHWRTWEELIAGAFTRYGYDVILTPRSGDRGRDFIASKKGVGSVRILGSVKAYSPGHLIAREEVLALLGEVTADRNASKGLFATTSDFAPGILRDADIQAYMPNRLELMNGKQLQEWLKSLTEAP